MSWEREPLGIRASLRHGVRKYKPTWLRHVTFQMKVYDTYTGWSANMGHPGEQWSYRSRSSKRCMDSVVVGSNSWFTWGDGFSLGPRGEWKR